MAVDVIFRTSYVNNRNGASETWRVDIVDVNAATVEDDPAPFTLTERGALIKWGSDRPLYEPIIASEVTLVARIVGDSTFRTWAENTLPTEQENRYFLRLYRNSELDWTGVILQDRIEFYDRDVYEYTIRAICGIGRLKEIKPIDDFTRVGRVSLMREMANILDYASVYPLFLYNNSTPFLATNFKWFADEMPITLGTGDPFRYISYENLGVGFSIDEQTGDRVWRNLYEYLRAICINFGLTITHAKGCWRVFQINDSTYLSNAARFYTYGWPITQGTNPSTGAVHVIASYTTVDNLAEVPSNYLPLAATRNAFAPALKSVSASVVFVANGVVLKRINNTFATPATEAMSFIQGLGLIGELSALIDINPSLIPPFHNAYIVAKISLSNTDGVNTRHLANSGQWFNGVVVQTFGDANSTPVSTTTPLPISISLNFQTPQIPYVGDITFNVTYHLFDEVAQTEISGGVIASTTTVTISTYVIDQSEARGLSVQLENALTTQNSSVKAELGELLVIDRPATNTYRACLIWNGTELEPSTTWKINDTGSSLLLYALVLRDALIRQQVPARQKEGAFIGTAYPYTRARYNSTDNHIFVSGEYETGRKTWNRVMFQIIPTLTFSLSPILTTVIQSSDPISRGGVARRRSADFVPIGGGGVVLTPRIAATGIDEIGVPVGLNFPITAGTVLTVTDTTTGLSYRVTTSAGVGVGATTIPVTPFDLPGDLVTPVLLLNQDTTITTSQPSFDPGITTLSANTIIELANNQNGLVYLIENNLTIIVELNEFEVGQKISFIADAGGDGVTIELDATTVWGAKDIFLSEFQNCTLLYTTNGWLISGSFTLI